MNLGIVKASKGKYTEALYCYEKALKYRRNYHTCLYNLGNLVNSFNGSQNHFLIFVLFKVFRDEKLRKGIGKLEAFAIDWSKTKSFVGEHFDTFR